MALLPAEFAELEPFADWILPTERERYAKRLASTMDEMQAFYEAAFPLLDAANKYLERFGMDDLPDPSGTCCNDDVAGPGLVPGRGLLPAARPRLWRRLPRLGRRAEGLTPVGGVSATGAGRGGRRGRRATPRR